MATALLKNITFIHTCCFNGTTLAPDIFVPPDQVLDTVDLYFVRARQRRLSLRFLAWFVLGEQIQTDTHDSIEDARSALNLYKAYQRMEEEGTFDRKLEELYREGKQYVSMDFSDMSQEEGRGRQG